MDSTTIQGVRFSSTSGKPQVIELKAEIRNNKEVGRSLWLIGGVTGYESFCLDGKSDKNVRSRLYNMKARGWWACAGTRGRWDALYIHGMQMEKMIKDLQLERKVK